jgi:tetratricopeptide (TPR) repeat protein
MTRQRPRLWVKIRGAMAGDGDFQRLGPYVLLRTSGAGGMGRVDLSLRPEPGGIPTLCVLKRMHAELRSREQDARFRREANIARQLSHTAIARTLGVEEIDGELVLLQELVHGVDVRLLGTRLASAGERVPLATALHIGSEVARALAYAHAFGDLGIVHRDVTPDNVMLAFTGEVKLIDFGIARSDVDAALTSAGQIVGRPTYTAPEIWKGAQADRRADIYSLGVVLWQLLTGRRFAEARPNDQNTTLAPSAYNPDVSADLDAVVTRALAPGPEQRYQDAAELEEALRAFVPPDFVPERALAELLARHFDVPRERRMLAAEVERATRSLDRAKTVHEPAGDAAHRRVRPTAIARRAPARSRYAAIVATLGAAGVAIAASLGLHAAPPSAAQIAAPVSRPAQRAAVDSNAPPSPGSPLAEGHGPAPPQEPVVEAAARRSAHTPAIAVSAGRVRPAAVKTTRPGAVVAADELLKRAQDKFDVGETVAALALARQAANAGARAPAHLLIGEVLMSERRFDQAEQEFAEAARLDPGEGRASRLLTLVRETRSGRP